MKRGFDLFFSFIGILIFFIPVIIIILLSTISSGKFGLFSQIRIGKNAKPFRIFKIRTMREGEENATITLENDPRVTRLGRLLRRTKLDELPQLLNVFLGDMSMVGPRPDVPGYADELVGRDRLVLSVRPGITGPATLKYRDEEKLLATVEDPARYNDEVLWKDKVRINLNYVENWSFSSDLRLMMKTFFT